MDLINAKYGLHETMKNYLISLSTDVSHHLQRTCVLTPMVLERIFQVVKLFLLIQYYHLLEMFKLSVWNRPSVCGKIVDNVKTDCRWMSGYRKNALKLICDIKQFFKKIELSIVKMIDGLRTWFVVKGPRHKGF